jgi:phosphoribosylamine--glycine ligase
MSGKIKILLVGSGGREHALAWKLSQSPKVSHIYVVPGNGGTSSLPKTVNVTDVSASKFLDLVHFAKEKEVDLLIPGPEQPLVDGITDVFSEHAPGVKVFGPSKAAARLEGSKAFSKLFMSRYEIPTARYQNFQDYDKAKAYLDSISHSVVVKASGLAAGKGVIIPETKDEAYAALKEIMLDKAFGDAGDEVVIEEFLEGNEISILSVSDGKTIRSFPTAQDHKRALDNDQGLNTGGMGTYAPAPTKIVDAETLKEIDEKVLKPTIDGMAKEGKVFTTSEASSLVLTSVRISICGMSLHRLHDHQGRPPSTGVQRTLRRSRDAKCITASGVRPCRRLIRSGRW